MSSSPLWASARTASRTVLRATPNCSTSALSVGMREPTGHSPEVIWARSWAITWSASGVRRGEDSVMVLLGVTRGRTIFPPESGPMAPLIHPIIL